MNFLKQHLNYWKFKGIELQAINGEGRTQYVAYLYDTLSPFYDKQVNYKRRVKILKEIISRISVPYSSVLDLACGTGAVIDALPKQKKLTITGVDLSSEMLNIARDRFFSRQNITFKEADFLNVSFPKSGFDLIVIAHSIRFVPKSEERKFQSKIAEWLKPGGMFIVVRGEPIISIRNMISHNVYFPASEKGLIKALSPKLKLGDKFQTGIGRFSGLFLPGRVKAYYFIKK